MQVFSMLLNRWCTRWSCHKASPHRPTSREQLQPRSANCPWILELIRRKVANFLQQREVVVNPNQGWRILSTLAKLPSTGGTDPQKGLRCQCWFRPTGALWRWMGPRTWCRKRMSWIRECSGKRRRLPKNTLQHYYHPRNPNDPCQRLRHHHRNNTP